MTTPDGLYFTLRRAADRAVPPETPVSAPSAKAELGAVPPTTENTQAPEGGDRHTPPSFVKNEPSTQSWLRQVRDGCRVEEFRDGTFRIESIADGRHVTVTAEQYLRDARPLFWLENTP